MAASPSIDPARFPHEHLASASPDLLRSMLSTFIEALMGAEVDALCGASHGVRSPERGDPPGARRPRPRPRPGRAGKVYHLLRRQGGVAGWAVPRCRVERLMRAAGLRGVVRGRTPPTTTTPDPAANRAPDLVDRDFSAERPNELWLVYFTYVPTWSGTCFTAFVSDACSRRIVGWRTADAMPTALPLDALEMALWTRQRAGEHVQGLIHHSDAGSQGGFGDHRDDLARGGADRTTSARSSGHLGTCFQMWEGRSAGYARLRRGSPLPAVSDNH